MRFKVVVVHIVACVLLAPLCEARRDKKSEVVQVKDTQQTLTDAAVRSINVSKVKNGSIPGRIVPEYIMCAEPSPDIAKALAQSFSLGAGLNVSDGVAANAQLSFALGKARAESLAQLTTRLATIQLLRDGLYRACEAYANGAISDTTYAVLLSRYDDTMITMLLGEFVAGTVGNEAAIVKAGASADVVATVDKSPHSGRTDGDGDGYDDKKNGQSKETPEPDSAPSGDDDEEPSGSGDRSTDANANGETPEVATGETPPAEHGSGAARAKSTSTAEITTTRSVSTSRTKEVATSLERMQRTYLHNINSDAIVVACLSALGNGDATPDLLGALAQVQSLAQLLAAGDDKDGTHKQGLETALTELETAAANASLSPLASYCLTSNMLSETVKAQAVNLRGIFVARHIEEMLDEVLDALGDNVLTDEEAGPALLNLLKDLESKAFTAKNESSSEKGAGSD